MVDHVKCTIFAACKHTHCERSIFFVNSGNRPNVVHCRMAFFSRNVHTKIAKKVPFYCLFLILSIIFIQRWKKSNADTGNGEGKLE